MMYTTETPLKEKINTFYKRKLKSIHFDFFYYAVQTQPQMWITRKILKVNLILLKKRWEIFSLCCDNKKKSHPQAMFALSCARAVAHTGHETSAHKKT